MPVQTRSGDGKNRASHCIWKWWLAWKCMELVTHTKQRVQWSHVHHRSLLPLTTGKGYFHSLTHTSGSLLKQVLILAGQASIAAGGNTSSQHPHVPRKAQQMPQGHSSSKHYIGVPLSVGQPLQKGPNSPSKLQGSWWGPVLRLIVTHTQQGSSTLNICVFFLITSTSFQENVELYPLSVLKAHISVRCQWPLQEAQSQRHQKCLPWASAAITSQDQRNI